MPNPPRALLAALVALAAAGCTTEPVETPSAPAASASSAPEARPMVSLVGDAPVITADLLGGSVQWVLPSAFSLQAEAFDGWIIGFGSEQGDQRPFHLTSADATAWEVVSDDLVAQLGIEYTNPGPIPSSIVATADDAWTMFFWGTAAPENDRADIWRASAGELDGPWAVVPGPAVEHGPIDAWDGRGVDFPSVVTVDDGYLMIHGGAGFGETGGSMGVATSPDGVTWTKADGPVIEPGFCGDFDSINASQGRLLPMPGGGYLLPYGGYDGGDDGATVGLAASPDGRSWTCLSAEPIMTAADIPSSTGIHSIAATLDAEGHPLLLVESLLPDNAGSEVWLARIDLP